MGLKVRTAVLFVTACWVFSLAGSHVARAVTGPEIAEWCAGYPDAVRRSLCELYVGSGIELLQSKDRMNNAGRRICIPPGTPREALIKKVSDWLAANPGSIGKAKMIYLVADALEPEYGCR